MTPAIKNLVILLNTDSAGDACLERVGSLFPYLDVVADVYIVSGNIADDTFRIKRLVHDLVDFLQVYPFYRINIHPVHSFSFGASLEKLYRGFSQATLPFNQEAYSLQSVARLMILPILIIDQHLKKYDLRNFLTFLRERTMVPSLYLLSGIPAASFENLVNTERERILLELDNGEQSGRVLVTLFHHFGFDDLLAWTASQIQTGLPPCRSVVYDEARGAITVCLDSPPQDASWVPISSHTADPLRELLPVENDVLLRQHLRTPLLLKETLMVNDRMKEWADVTVKVAMESVKRAWYDEALQLFDAVLGTPQAAHDEATLCVSRALCDLKLDHISEAEAALAQAETFNPDLALIYYYRGHCEFAQRDYIEAIDLMRKALDMNPDHVPEGEAYFFMGMSHINIMEYDDGLRMMEKAEPFYSPNQLSPVLYYMGVCHYGNNDVRTAYEFFQKALAADPSPEDLSSIYLYLGMCHKEQEEYDKALEMLEQARDAEEDRLDIHNLMGFCHFKLKQHEKAIESFVRAVEIDPASGIDWANLGVNVRAMGDDDEAVLLLKKAVSLDPTIGFAWKHLQELTENKNS